MALIGKNNIRNADFPWPNPFDLKDSDAKGRISGYPTEVITLAMIEIMIQRVPTVKDALSLLRTNGAEGSFSWYNTKDGRYFWDNMRNRHFDIFYQVYTPTSLKERIEEARPLMTQYKPKKK